MTGINTGILRNASPLTAARIKELENDVLQNRQACAYLNENGELCFAMADGVEVIKDLAWNQAHELTTEAGTLIKKVYEKTGLKTFQLNGVFNKQSYNDSWVATDSNVLDGDGATYYATAPTTLSFRSTAPLNEFKDVVINGQVVDPSNYTLEEGSTVVKLSIDYLNTLRAGSHSVSIVSENKTVSGNFSVHQPVMSEYGFYYNTPYILPEEILGVNACIILTDTFFTMVDEPFKLAVFCIGPEVRTFGGYFLEGDHVRLASFDGSLDASLQVSEYVIVATTSMEDDSGESSEVALPFYLDTNSKIYATDGTHLYALNDDAESYSVGSVTLTMDRWVPILTGINGLPTTAISARGYEGVHITDKEASIAELPATVTTIKDGAFCGFAGCVHIPNTVTAIGAKIFVDYVGTVIIDSLEHWCTGISFAEQDDDNLMSGSALLHAALLCDGVYISDLVVPDSVSCVSQGAFSGWFRLYSVVLPVTTTRITNAFARCYSLQNITYNGTMAQWRALPKEDGWNDSISAEYVQCSDGQVAI